MHLKSIGITQGERKWNEYIQRWRTIRTEFGMSFIHNQTSIWLTHHRTRRWTKKILQWAWMPILCAKLSTILYKNSFSIHLCSRIGDATWWWGAKPKIRSDAMWQAMLISIQWLCRDKYSWMTFSTPGDIFLLKTKNVVEGVSAAKFAWKVALSSVGGWTHYVFVLKVFCKGIDLRERPVGITPSPCGLTPRDTALPWPSFCVL
jgi:hypothetical protein